ncbi:MULTISPECIES: type II secretion system F family protein [Anaerostipes]|uniref:type II secretion system F family protein n=1 Tax=Anaerostipes TaxID=207244 RepID=UPI001C1E3E43|nr:MULTISPECIES: type II secretion system F family protein [Anaerostipes]MCI5622204.1 type II secretion system F family protein [Anaerostipes sp.]
MKNIRSLWNSCKKELTCWKSEKRNFLKGICISVFICWLFFNSAKMLIFMIPLAFPWMKYQRGKERKKQKEVLQRQLKEMMLSVSNSLSVGYSLEHALEIALEDLKILDEGKGGVLEKELELLIISMKVNEPVEKLLIKMAENINLEELTQFAQIVVIVRKNGGNLMEIIGKTVNHLNESMQLKEEIRTMTAAKQMEKNIMTVMPFFVLFYVRMTNPGYFSVLYETVLGKGISMAAVLFLMGASIWAERVVTIEI